MSVFSVTALDRLIESDRRSSISTEKPAAGPSAVERQQKSAAAQQGERRPLYVSHPYPSTTSAASTPPRPRSPSPTSFSPSPYVVNHKRRVPNGVDPKRASQQNGFHVSDKSFITRPSESQQLLASGKQQNSNAQQDWSSSGRAGSNKDGVQDQGQGGLLVKQQQNSRSPVGSLTLQFQAKKKDSNGENTDENPWCRKANPDEIHVDGHISTAAGPEEKTKGKRVGSVEKREMSSRSSIDARGKKKVDDSYTNGSSYARMGNASSSSGGSGAGVSDSRHSSNSASEEWFDASDGLQDYSSDDDLRRSRSSDPGPSSRGDPGYDVVMQQLKVEVQRRIAAEEAREALQRQRDGMAQMLSSAGISIPQGGLGTLKKAEIDKVLGVSSGSESQRIEIARYVAGAVATGAVKAEAEAELQTVLAEKSKEIARLKDKLQYYELVNHEMSHRNQESIENNRQTRRRRQRIQRLVVFGLSAAICVGVSVAAIYHYVPWEHYKDLALKPALPEGEQANTVSLEQVVELENLNPEN